MSFNCSTDEKEKQDPLAFRDAIIQGLQDIGNNDLEQVSYTISFLCALLLRIIGMLHYIKFLWSYCKSSFNPLTPRTDKHVTSPYTIHTLFNKQVMRILKLISTDKTVIYIYQSQVAHPTGVYLSFCSMK